MRADIELKRWTGEGAVWWLRFLGEEIGGSAKPIKGTKGLSVCYEPIWIVKMSMELSERARERMPTNAVCDNNIHVAKLLALILTLWVARIWKAKALDPRRELRDRRRTLKSLRWHEAMLGCFVDETLDAALFPDQEWDFPFSKTARCEPDEMELKRQAYGKKLKSKKKR